MKKSILNLGFPLLVMAVLFLASCGNAGHDHDHEGHDHEHEGTEEVMDANEDGSTEASMEETSAEEVDMTGPEYTSAYVCPMHCKGSGSAEAGNCPVCGMEYIALTDHEGEDHQH